MRMAPVDPTLPFLRGRRGIILGSVAGASDLAILFSYDSIPHGRNLWIPRWMIVVLTRVICMEREAQVSAAKRPSDGGAPNAT